MPELLAEVFETDRHPACPSALRGEDAPFYRVAVATHPAGRGVPASGRRLHGALELADAVP